jgi:hypothetical protein
MPIQTTSTSPTGAVDPHAPNPTRDHAQQGVVPTGEPLPDESDEGDYFIRQADLDRAALQRGRG